MQLVLGADCVVRKGEDVLLLKREDFRVWTIPGGGTEPGESPADTAIRETREETGVEVALDALVGVYTYARADNLLFLYAAHPTGGAPHTSIESVDVGYFPPDRIPDRILGIHHERLIDGLNEQRGIFRRQALSRRVRIVLPVLLRARKLRNRLQGRPEAPPVWHPVSVQGIWADDSAVSPVEIDPVAGQPIWDTLRAEAESISGRRVTVTHAIDVTRSGGAVIVRFALRSDGAR